MSYARNYVRDLAANCSPTLIRIMKRQTYQYLTEMLGAVYVARIAIG